MTPRPQRRRHRPAPEHRCRQRRIRQRARLRPAQPRLRRPRDHVSDRRAGDPLIPGDRPVAGAACRLRQHLPDVVHSDRLSAHKPPPDEGDDPCPEPARRHPEGAAELKSASVAELTLDSAADLTLETPAELISYWPADLRRLPHPGCRLVCSDIERARRGGLFGASGFKPCTHSRLRQEQLLVAPRRRPGCTQSIRAAGIQLC
jgi:hypothetical protein